MRGHIGDKRTHNERKFTEFYPAGSIDAILYAGSRPERDI